ncbi:MAG: SDR family oxidoreductase [Arcticibacter sp.]
MKEIKSLNNCTVVITGASSGAGRAMALEFALHQARLVLAARNEAALMELAEECRELGSKVLIVPADLSDAKAVINLAGDANNFGDGIDVWINNAGVLTAGEFDKVPMEVHAQVIQTNLMSFLFGAHAVIPYFKKQGSGILINNISVGGFLPVPFGTSYTASKFGLRGFSEALKAELQAWKDIHVCDLFPAFLDTPGIQHAGNYTGKVLKPAPPVYDPMRLAKAAVSLAVHPRSSVTVGSVSTVLRLAHSLMPELTAGIVARVIRTYLRTAEPTEVTSGNVFNPLRFGTSTHGGWGLPGRPKAHRKYIVAAAVIAGVLSAGFLSGRR